MTKPEKSILSRDFRYVDAANTDVAATFKRARKQIRDELAARSAAGIAEYESWAKEPANVRQIRRRA